MPLHSQTIRCLLIVAVTLPFALLVLGGSPTPKESDLQNVFVRLPEQTRYEDLQHWCGLGVSEATPKEVARLREAVENAPDPRQVWCGFLDERRRGAPPGTYKFPEGIRWYRIGDPWNPSQWIGIGVYDFYSTARTTPVIRCRVAVGFEPGG